MARCGLSPVGRWRIERTASVQSESKTRRVARRLLVCALLLSLLRSAAPSPHHTHAHPAAASATPPFVELVELSHTLAHLTLSPPVHRVAPAVCRSTPPAPMPSQTSPLSVTDDAQTLSLPHVRFSSSTHTAPLSPPLLVSRRRRRRRRCSLRNLQRPAPPARCSPRTPSPVVTARTSHSTTTPRARAASLRCHLHRCLATFVTKCSVIIGSSPSCLGWSGTENVCRPALEVLMGQLEEQAV